MGPPLVESSEFVETTVHREEEVYFIEFMIRRFNDVDVSLHGLRGTTGI